MAVLVTIWNHNTSVSVEIAVTCYYLSRILITKGPANMRAVKDRADDCMRDDLLHLFVHQHSHARQLCAVPPQSTARTTNLEESHQSPPQHRLDSACVC